MHWLQSIDDSVFRFINGTLSNPFFDVVMPFVSGNGSMAFFAILVLVIGLMLLCRGGARGRLCVLMLSLILGPGDGCISNTIKHAVARPRPYLTLPDVNLPGSKKPRATITEVMGNTEGDTKRAASLAGYNSMPSSHAANWFAATMILFLYFRRTLWIMLPIACLVAFSRIYNGVHYPSDVIAGSLLGAGYAAAGVILINAIWQWAGRKWFPLWFKKIPSLVITKNGTQKTEPDSDESGSEPEPDHAALDSQWLHLGYVLIAVLLAARLAYLHSGLIQLSEDEAYQWVWSKHPALSYFSKPPMIAYTQWVSTHLFGDTEFGVRFFSPVLGSIAGFLLLRFFARNVNARAGFFLLLLINATPLMALGSIVMTVDPLSVLFWIAAMIAGWRAVQPDSKTSAWLWTGLWMGLGFLSKYTELFQLLCWAIFFILWKPARAQLRKPGPYLALLVHAVCTLPVLIWNSQRHWVTVAHVANNAQADRPWQASSQHLLDFLAFIGLQTALLNPIFFIATTWAAIAFWRRGRHDPRLVYLFSMGAPIFLTYMLFSFHSNVLPNWIAPSVLPLFSLTVIYWDTRWRLGVTAIRNWFIAGMALGLLVNGVMHNTDVIQKLAGKPLPPKIDPMTRMRAYDEMARVVDQARTHLMAEGKPTFIIAGHYGITGQLSFHLPEARTNIVSQPLVYNLTIERPVNQFYFWPGYRSQRQGQNAIFVRELSYPSLVSGWPLKWLHGETNLASRLAEPKPTPPMLLSEFESVTDLGVHPVYYRDRVFHYIQLFECRNLR